MAYSALIAVTLVSLFSLIGALFLLIKRESISRFMSPILAFSSGVLLGTTFLDLMPESIEKIGDNTYFPIIVGILVFFILEKLLQWHHHMEDEHEDKHKTMGYLSLIGDSLHNFTDGIIIGGGFLISNQVGIAVTIAVIAHEIPHELADFTILIHSGFSNSKALFFNFLSATTAIIGTLTVLTISSVTDSFVNYLIPFAAGNFLYIAMSDLIPELHHPRSRRATFIQIAAIVFGVFLISILPGE